MKKNIIVLFLLVLFAGIFLYYKANATDVVVQNIRNGDALDATPVNSNDAALARVINGLLDSNNIKDNSLKAIDFENDINLNSKLAVGSIGIDKANTDWFSASYPVYKNTGLNSIDLRISSRLLNSAGTLDLNANSITGFYLSNTLFDSGLSFNQSDSKVYVKVDAAYHNFDVADSIFGTITYNDSKQLTLQASVSLDGGTTYIQPNIAISANANDSLQTTDKTSIVSAINEVYNNSKTNYISLNGTFERIFQCAGEAIWDTLTFYGYITRENEYNKLVGNDTFQSNISLRNDFETGYNIFPDTLYIIRYSIPVDAENFCYYLSVNDSLVLTGTIIDPGRTGGNIKTEIYIKDLFKLYNKTSPDKWTFSYYTGEEQNPYFMIAFKNAIVYLKE